MNPLRIAIVGYGKIARDRHVPAIAATEGVVLSAIADPNTSLSGVPHTATLDELLRNGPPVDAVALCTPPQLRRDMAAMALAARKHVLLEKPPGATVGEIVPLLTAAAAARCALFSTWRLPQTATRRSRRHCRFPMQRDCRSRPISIFARPVRRPGTSMSTPTKDLSGCLRMDQTVCRRRTPPGGRQGRVHSALPAFPPTRRSGRIRRRSRPVPACRRCLYARAPPHGGTVRGLI